MILEYLGSAEPDHRVFRPGESRLGKQLERGRPQQEPQLWSRVGYVRGPIIGRCRMDIGEIDDHRRVRRGLPRQRQQPSSCPCYQLECITGTLQIMSAADENILLRRNFHFFAAVFSRRTFRHHEMNLS